jgi:ferric-dicitrate binding protein FerR (iron transport regulator)
MRIASVFVLGFALYYFFLFNTDINIETLVGQKTTIELPDASVVVLNASSEIEYSKKGWNKKRSLHLTGEAFFDVIKGATFDVITPSGTVTVLGTEFNVKQRGAAFEVVCYEGSVRVDTGPYLEVLKAGDRLRFTDGKLYVGKTPNRNPQWTGNVSDFQQIPFLEVIQELERQYKVKIVRTGVPVETLFTGGFVHDNLLNALQSIAEPMDLNFVITDNNEVILTTREN